MHRFRFYNLLVFFCLLSSDCTPLNSHSWKYRGAAVTGFYYNSFNSENLYKSVDYLIAMGVNSIEVVVTWYQDGYNADILAPHPQKSILDEDLITLLRYLREHNITINLKPHCEADIESDHWRARIDPVDTDLWFDSYRRFLLYYLTIAIREEVDIFTVGTEMISMTRSQYFEQWRRMMEDLRQHQWNDKSFAGLLTYAAHEHELFGREEFVISDENSVSIKPLDADFWRLFDIMSTTVYYKLPGEATASVQELMDGWFAHLQRLKDWRRSLGLKRRLIIAEAGYRSVDFAQRKPYLATGAVIEGGENRYNPQNQANCFQAMLESLQTIPWIDGLYYWQEEMSRPPIYRQQNHQTGYSVINKPAAQIIQSFYALQSDDPLKESTTTDLLRNPLRDNPTAIDGHWYYYSYPADSADKENSYLPHGADDTPRFLFMLRPINGVMREVASLGRLIDANPASGILGMGVDFSEENFDFIRQRLSDGRGIRFTASGDNRLYRIRVETDNITNFNYYGAFFRPGKGDFVFEIPFAELHQEDWGSGTRPVPFAVKRIVGISIQTVKPPLFPVELELYDFKVIPAIATYD